MHVVFQVNNCLHHDVEILCLTTLDMLIQTVLIIIDRSAVVLVRFYVVGIMHQFPVSGGSDMKFLHLARLGNWGFKKLQPALMFIKTQLSLPDSYLVCRLGYEIAQP